MAIQHLIDLDEAVSRIEQACNDRDENQLSPFFFMVGAGISIPSVPLASEIVTRCKETANQYGRTAEPKLKDPIDVYSHWFECAYGEPNQRQRYLRQLIEGKQITHANFRLAHLLLNDNISNVVVTTNFDDFLTKALNLFGKRHIVCDHPHMVGRINHTARDLQIVHMHGTYWFYDCCNLRGELQDRAQQSHQTATTMASLLDMILWDRSPLIIGYSGWEGDVFMNALKRRLVRPLGSNAYWFCYQRNAVDSMPNWLKDHPNIRFVVPEEPATRTPSTEAGLTEETSEVPSEFGEQIKGQGFTVVEDHIQSLPADKVLDGLIRSFDLDAPSLTKDPLGFFAERLDESLPKDEASDKDVDIYAIKNVIERVRRAKRIELEETGTIAKTSTEKSFEMIRDALRRADYRTAINLGTRLPIVGGLSIEQLNELSAAAWLAAIKLNDNSSDEISAYDLILAISDTLSELSPNEAARNLEEVAKALVNKGFVLGTLNRTEDAISIYDEVVRRFGESQDLALREQVAKALRSKGLKLAALNRNEEAITVYDEVVQRFGDAAELALRKVAANALFDKGLALGALNRSDEKLTVYENVIRLYGDAPESGLREIVARTVFNKGFVLWTLNRSEDAITIYDEVVRRFGESKGLALREQVAKALVNKGFVLGTLNRSEDAITICDEVVRRFGESQDLALREQVAKALSNKGSRLTVLNRNEEAITVYDEVMRRFGDAAELALREVSARALLNKGLAFGALNRSDDAIVVYEEVVRRYSDAPESGVREIAAKALWNKGLAFGVLNRSDAAIAVYEEVVRRYGDAHEPALRTIVTNAFNGIGFRSMIDAKELRLANDEHSAQEKLSVAHVNLNTAIERSPDDPLILGNQAYLAFLSGRKNESLEILRRAISLGGEEIKKGELSDADINRLPQDDEFCEMVHSISSTSFLPNTAPVAGS